MLGTHSLSHGYYDQFYKKAEKARQLIIQNFEAAFKTVDLIFAPTTPSTAIKKGVREVSILRRDDGYSKRASRRRGNSSNQYSYGSDSNKLPIGLSFMGGRLEEEKVLSIAYQLEKETNFMNVRETLLTKFPD